MQSGGAAGGGATGGGRRGAYTSQTWPPISTHKRGRALQALGRRELERDPRAVGHLRDVAAVLGRQLEPDPHRLWLAWGQGWGSYRRARFASGSRGCYTWDEARGVGAMG
eukprot:scaffold54906_cov69-Phaeocystis_antarctica.AAC.1